MKSASLAFAVNLAPEESDFTLLKEAEIRKLLPENVSLTFVDASAEAQDLHGSIGWTGLRLRRGSGRRFDRDHFGVPECLRDIRRQHTIKEDREETTKCL